MDKHWCFISTANNDRMLFHRIIEALGNDRKTIHYNRLMPCRAQYMLSDIEIVIVWSGGMPKALYEPLSTMAIPVCYIENGYFPNTIHLDHIGINYNSSVALLGNEEFDEMLLRMPIDEEKKQYLYDEQFDQLPFRYASEVSDADDNDPLPDKYIFIPLQCKHDGNMINYANGFTNESFVLHVLENIPDGYSLVVKEHPSDVGRIDYTEFRRSLGDAVQWRRTSRADDILRGAEELWTINGSLAMEGLRKKKKVRVFGQSIFARFANDVEDDDLIMRFLYYMRWNYSIHTNCWGHDIEGNKQVVWRLKQIATRHYPWLEI